MIEVRSDEALCTEDPDIGVALIVGKNDDDVGGSRARRAGGHCGIVGQQQSKKYRANEYGLPELNELIR